MVATKYSLRDPTPTRAIPTPAAPAQEYDALRGEKPEPLQTDTIDLYYVHMWDYTTPVEEVLRGFEDLIRAGKVLHAGFSDTPAGVSRKPIRWQSCGAGAAWQPSNCPTAWRTGLERGLLPMAQADDLAVTAWGILEAGILTGKHRDP